MAKEITELSLDERLKKANEEIQEVLKKYNVSIQPQIDKEYLTAFVQAMKIRLLETPEPAKND